MLVDHRYTRGMREQVCRPRFCTLIEVVDEDNSMIGLCFDTRLQQRNEKNVVLEGQELLLVDFWDGMMVSFSAFPLLFLPFCFVL